MKFAIKLLLTLLKKAVGNRESVQLKALADKFSTKLIETAAGDNLEKLQNLEKQFKDLIDSVPAPFRIYESESHINRDTCVLLNLAGEAVDWMFDKEEIFPLTRYNNRYVIPQGHELISLMENYRAEDKNIRDIKSNVRENVKALVYSVTTVKKLLEVWPESMELIPTNVAKQVVQLPSIKIEQLNALIGVPSEK